MSTGLRERKKAATRQALHESALQLAVELGMDRVTIDAIADAASVSRRTFSNYFANKEEALLYGDHERTRQLLDLVLARPVEESAWTALSASAYELVADLGARDPGWVARIRFIREHPSLVVHQVAMYASLERELAAAISTRMPADDGSGIAARLVTAVFLTALRVAINTWLDHPPGTTIRELVDLALGTVAASFG